MEMDCRGCENYGQFSNNTKCHVCFGRNFVPLKESKKIFSGLEDENKALKAEIERLKKIIEQNTPEPRFW